MKTEHRGSVLTFDAISEKYTKEKFIILLPQVSRHLMTAVPMWSLDVAEVDIDPDNNSQAYNIQKDDYGLTKVSLDLMAQAGDLTVLCKRIDDRRDRMFAEYEAHAIMNTPSGGVRGQGRTCEWDGVLAQQKVRHQAKNFVQYAQSKQWNNYKNLSDEQFAQRVDERFNDQWLREQEFGKRMVESKAGNRAVRALLGIQNKYHYNELKSKKFAIVRFVFTPDLEDREVKLMVIGAGLHAQRMLYPGIGQSEIDSPTALPAPALANAEAIDHNVATAESVRVGDGKSADETIFAPTVTSVNETGLVWDDAQNVMPQIYVGLANTKKTMFTKLQKRLAKYTEQKDADGMIRLYEYMVEEGLIGGEDK